MSAIFFLPKPLILDTNGELASTWTLRFFVANTTTPKTVYSDAALSIAITQPIAVASTGVFPRIFIGTGAYKVGLYTDTLGTIAANGYPVDDCDTGIPAGSGALPVANGGTGATTAAGARTNLATASQADLNTQAAALAAIQAAITALPSSSLNDLAGLDLLTRAYLASGFGVILLKQAEVAASTAQATAAGTIPFDNSIPQISEGTEVLTGTFTPVDAASTLEIIVDVMAGNASDGSQLCIALFKNTDPDAIQARWTETPDATDVTSVYFAYRVTSGVTSAITFSVRIGTPSGSAYLNGNTGRIGGGAVRSTLYIKEWKAY